MLAVLGICYINCCLFIFSYFFKFNFSFFRLELYKYLECLQERILYNDTDSVIYIQKPGDTTVPIGYFLGDMTDEMAPGDYITEFVSGT